jgi:hypothetical protein
MTPVGFQNTISAGKRQQTYPLDRTATGTGSSILVEENLKARIIYEQCTHFVAPKDAQY